VVTRSDNELSDLDELFVRAERNGVVVERLTAEDVQRLEPEARTVGEALYSPTTSSVDPREVVASLVDDAAAAGIEVRTGTVYRRRRPGGLMTSRGAVAAGYVVNTAGLYADRIARDYGFGEQYGILPFRGLYLHYVGSAPVPKCHVYPVPRLDNPFLGVHWTTHANGRVTIGPTAIPAFWREHYKGLSNFKFNEVLEIGIRESGLWLRNTQGFRALAWNEMRKRSKRKLVRLARGLVGESTATGEWAWGSPGVRAQLFDTKKRRLEMDFVCLGDDKSFHVLNAVSPAFTCALPFARHVVAEIESRLPGNRSRGRTESHFTEVQDIVPIESNILPTAHSGSGASLNE
jgi:L-2-hydroxyglutarate oxidase LhgO